ncbi:MAG: sigma-54-dependent Fis family transcriptional regulator [Gemmatimonadales bacterium]|nr:MAG: sigma-54-dependent Fis family transcriptional regulator [Gemmatimonadales bacterium]
MKVLVVDDDSGLRRALTLILEDGGYTVETAVDGESGLRLAGSGTPDMILTDVRMPGMDGLAMVEQLRAGGSQTPVVVMTAYGSMDLAVEAVRRGASDYITKPFGATDVLLTLRKVEERFALNRDADRPDAGPGSRRYGALVAAAPAMVEVAELALKVAPHPTSVLIQGPTGTGKELLARLLHDHSERAAGPFIPVNCGAIPDTLMESEFFGVLRGAYTGAERDRPGLFESASGGTLFLDEVGELPEALQVKLLRVLQEGRVRRLGAESETEVDVRVVGATNRCLLDEVGAGRFREDLYYRLAVVTLQVPPLRERPEDLELLVENYLQARARRLGVGVPDVSDGAMAVLRVHRWPGNVRELENVLERALILSDGGMIRAGDLPAGLASALERPLFSGSAAAQSDPVIPPDWGEGSDTAAAGNAEDPADRSSEDLSVKRRSADLERDLIQKALERTGGHRGQARELLDLSDRALRYKIREYGLEDTSGE